MNYTQATQSVSEVQADLIKRFTHFENWKDRYKYLIDMGKTLQTMPEAYKTEDNRIHGCQSQVWIHIEEKDGILYMEAMSDSAIVSGLIALLLKVYHGRSAQEILQAPLEFLGQIGLIQHLSANRSTGLYHMIKRIQAEASARVAQH